jgi:hypothetical protein
MIAVSLLCVIGEGGPSMLLVGIQSQVTAIFSQGQCFEVIGVKVVLCGNAEFI